MATLLYHTGTGAYFALEDGVVAINTNHAPEDALQALYENDNDEVIAWGDTVVTVITEGGTLHSVIA